MKAENFDLDAYCQRIGFQGEPRNDIAGISDLMRHQLFSIPFENLDVQAGKIISLIPEEIVDKIIQRRRGGYCYESNGLFAMALEALGVSYRFIACRPMIYPTLRPRTHMALIIEIESESWLCDTSFGGYGIRAPIKLSDTDREICQDDDYFLLTSPGEGDYLLKTRNEGAWSNLYGFDLWPQQWVDFVPANYLNSTHPETIFVQHRLVVLHHPQGRSILFDNRLKRTLNGQTETRDLPPEEIDGVLSDLFGLRL